MVAISVVCPTYNSAEFIEKTLGGVYAQDRLPDELIISDDGSTDGTVGIVQRYLEKANPAIKWRILCNSHRGPGAARNLGIAEVTSDWVAFLDSDDLWLASKIARVERAIAESQEANFICHDEIRVKHNGVVAPLVYGRHYRPEAPLTPQLYLANMFSTSAVICRKDLLTHYGGFDESLLSAQDYELWLRLSPSIKPIFIHEVLGKYVERKGNITSGKLLYRMKNELRIAWMHRSMVSEMRYIFRVARILLSYVKQFVVRYLY